MACNYSNKFLPLVLSMAESFEGNEEAFKAHLAGLFTNPEVAIQDAAGLITFESEVKEQKSTDHKAPVRLNTRQATIGVQSGSSISSAYLGRSDAYSEMIKNFRRKILELSRIQIDFTTGSVKSFDSNASGSVDGLSQLNENLFNYKLELIERILTETDDLEALATIKEWLDNGIKTQDWDYVNSILNTLIGQIKMYESIPDKAYDAYVILMNFDKLLKQECPYIEVDSRYDDKESIQKYKYVGANVSHFTGWTSSEFANSMDQASMLVKAILDYIPEVNEYGPIDGSSIGLSGFYSVMTALRNTLLYHAEGELLELRKNLIKGVKVDMVKLIDAYIDYLQSPSQNTGNVSSFYDSHKTYLIGKLNGIRNFIFDSNIDKELKDIFNNMFFKNVQMSYVAYTYDPYTEEFGGTDLKASAINQQTYGLSGTIASAIYNFRTNPDSFQTLVNSQPYKGQNPKYLIKSKNRSTGELTLIYKGKTFSFGQKSITTDFDLQEFKDIFFDLFGYIIPDNYVDVSKQINGDNSDFRTELGEVLRLGLQGPLNWGRLRYDDDRNFPSNINDWYTTFAKVGKIISTIYGADTVNVIKNVNKKNNLPLYGLTSLAYNFPFIMWNHMDDDSEKNIYADSFLFDKVDPVTGTVVSRSIVGEPKVRSEVMYNGKLKSTSKMTVAEVAKLSILDDFYRNLTDDNADHIYIQNATFADKGTHFLVNYNLNTAIGPNGETLKQLIDDHMSKADPNSTEMFKLMQETRARRIIQLVDNILADYSKVFGRSFNELSDITAYIAENNLSHNAVRRAFVEKNVDFYEEVHLSKGKVNETIALYYDTFTDPKKLADRLDNERKKFVADLKSNRVEFSIHLDSISKKIGNKYKDWVNPDGSLILSKEINGRTVLHPVLEGYFMSNDLLSNEYNEVMIGGVYCHSKNTESSRLIAQIKRSVIFGATMHSFAQGLENGVAEEVKIACMPDVQAYVQNLVGTEQTNDSMDGSGLCTMLQARLESNSLLDARVGYDKKSIGHDIDSKYGRPSLLKWAVYAMTNARRRIAYGSNISQEILCRKAYSAGNIDLTTEELNSILKQIGPVYFKDTEKTGKYFKIISIKVDPETGVIKRALQEVTSNGTEMNRITSDSIQLTNTLWDIDQVFGGAWAMKFENDTLEYSESNVDALESYVVKHQDAKTKQIGYIVNKSAMKVGIGNLNTEDSWTDNSKFSTITMRTRYLGIQMDAEHHLDEAEVTEMTQMISALSENGYTSEIVNSIYTDIGNVIMEALKQYDTVIQSGDSKALYKLLGEVFIKSFENNDRDTLGLAQAFVLKATQALKEAGSDFRLPFSAETVSGLFMSTVSSMLNKKGIRRKYEGFAGVLTPSYNMMQYYRVAGQTMMYDRFTDLVREKGITSYNTTSITQSVPTTKIISGGQTGVDTIGLEVGRELGLQTGGTATPGFIRESGVDSYDRESLQSLFGLTEISPELQAGKTGREFYLPRTEQNVLNSDATVYFASDPNSAGRIATERFARAHDKKFIVNPTAEQLRKWLIDNNIKTLNVAGNRGSKLGQNNVADVLRAALDDSATSKAINKVWINNELNPFLEEIPSDQVDFEDTVVIFNTDIHGNVIRGTERIMYIQSFSQYDEFKHMNMTGKKVYNFTSRPKNLKATNTKFKVAGVQHSVYELDSVRAMFYHKQGINPEFVTALLNSRGYTAVESDKMFGTLQKIVQRDLRHLEKGRSIQRISVLKDGSYTVSEFTATDVQVTPAELITGRYHAKEFMMDSHDNISDIMAKGELYFEDKLKTKYNFTEDEPVWAEMTLFSESGERYLVKTISENEKMTWMSEHGEFVNDSNVEEINGSYYIEDKEIIESEGIKFYKHKDKDGLIWNVILVDSEETKQDLYRSNFFEFYRNMYADRQLQNQEKQDFERRISRRAKLMFESFKRQRKMLGTRIPTQAMQSFMPMEIVGYTDSEVNDVYVPVQQFFLQGSDLDIDKVYLLGYGVNESGKIQINSKLAEIAEYDYDDLMRLLPPNGKKYERSQVMNTDSYILDGSRLSTESFIDIINDVIKSGKSKVFITTTDPQADVFMRQLNTHTRTKLSDSAIDAAIKNQVVHNVLKVASNAENQVIAQISVDAATVDLKAAAKTSHLAAYEKTITSDNPLTVFTMQVQNMVGREVIGVTAVALKQFFAKTAFYNDKINRYVEECIKNPSRIKEYTDRLLQLVVKNNPLTGKQTVFANLNFLDVIDAINEGKIEDVDIDLYGFKKLSTLMAWLQAEADKNDAALTISGILTLATDNAKELILSKLNATSALVDIYTYLTALGTDTKTIADIMISGSFTYIAKLQEGDLFNSFTNNITIENAIRFYLGDYNMNIDQKILYGLFGVSKKSDLKSALYDSDKVNSAIQKCLDGLKKKKEQEAELRAWRREQAENGQDLSEEFDQQPEVDMSDLPTDERGNVIIPPPDITTLSAPDIHKVIAFLNECLKRNDNRATYALDKQVDENLTLILNLVLPGVKEQSMMGKMAGINQGIKTKAFDKISFKQNIENYITGAYETSLKNQLKNIELRLKQLSKELNNPRTDPAVKENLNRELTMLKQQEESIQQQLKNLVPFDFYKFILDKTYQNNWIKIMGQIKHTDNILEIIVNVPHFKQMLHTWAIDETLLRRSSVRFNLERHLLDQIKPNQTHTFKELEFNQVKQYVNDHLILNWLFDNGFSINIDQDQIDNYNIEVYDAAGIPTSAKAGEFKLDSIMNIDSFKHLMETWIVPELKKRFGDNAFLQALTQTSDQTKSGVKTYLKLPIPMMDIDKSVELETKYNQYLMAFDEISTQMFAGMKIADLFYLYNLIVNKDSFGQKSMTRLFENLVNSNKGSFLVNSYNEWIANLDASGDFSRLQMDPEDLKGRISQYVPESKIEGELDGIMTKDSCFEVPHLAKSPIRITTRKTIDPQPQIQAPTLMVLKDILPPFVMKNYSDDLSSGSEVKLLSDEDWDDAFMGHDYLDENRDFLRKQKSFIYNGELYINIDNASFGDMVHEWAHIILAQMKWSSDPQIRDKYYEIVSKVVDHPRFNDIAQNYPWANGSDLQEEVLVNLFQMYLQNKVFTEDNILKELGMLSSKNFVDSYDGLIELVEQTFIINVDQNISLEDATLSDMVQLFGSGFYDQYLRHDNSYVLKKHQKVSAMKDQMIKDETLKMICK